MFLELPSSSAIHWQLVTVDHMKRKKRFTFDSLTAIIYTFMMAKHLYFDWLGLTTWTEEILRSKKYPAHWARG